MLSRGLLESEQLPAVLAHELGHLCCTDGRVSAAINRMVLIPPRIGAPNVDQEPDSARPPATGQAPATHIEYRGVIAIALTLGWRLLRLIFTIARSGLMLRLARPLFGAYWREREYKADAYAATLGHGEELAEFLEIHALIHDQPVPFIWLTEHTHPPSELRIEKLRAAAQQDHPTESC